LIHNLVSLLGSVKHTPQDWDYGDEIDECLSILAVVDDTGLTLLISSETFV
jgi:hypothetical protein